MLNSKFVGQNKSNYYNEYDIIPFFPWKHCDRWYQIGDMHKSPGSHNVSTRLDKEPGVASLFIGLLKPCLSLQRSSRVWEAQHGCPCWFWSPSSLVPPRSCTWSTRTFQSFQSVLFFWFILGNLSQPTEVFHLRRQCHCWNLVWLFLISQGSYAKPGLYLIRSVSIFQLKNNNCECFLPS